MLIIATDDACMINLSDAMVMLNYSKQRLLTFYFVTRVVKHIFEWFCLLHLHYFINLLVKQVKLENNLP